MLSDEAIDQAIIDGNRRILKGDAELLLRACKETDARVMVEVGSFDGGSSIVLGSWAKLHAGILYCIEPFPTARWKANMEKYKLERNVHLITEASPAGAIKVPNDLDVLFVDGDHRPTHTIADFIAFAPLLRVGGIWIQHDWCGRPGKQYGGRSVSEMIHFAVGVILEDYGACFEAFGESVGSDRGAVAFRKIKDMKVNIR